MLEHLFRNNARWSERMRAQDPAFFQKLLAQQAPEFLWIGCADSRVPANEIVGLMPGELFVHRNVANVVVHTDLNCLSVLQFAVDVLKVKHIIVCGHYGCGGIRATLDNDRLGLTDNWLRHVQDVRKKYATPLGTIAQNGARCDKLCELNVVEQAVNVCETTIVQDAWARGQSVSVHGWIYGLRDGRLHDLGIRVAEREQLTSVYDAAIEGLLRT
jgi:carbonic anhydrase